MAVGAPTPHDTLAPSKRRRLRPRRPTLPGGSRLRVLDDRGRAPVMGHLEELRWRIVAIAATFAVAMATAYWFRDTIFGALNRPLPDDVQVQTLAVTEPFFTSLTIAANVAFAATLPVIAYNAYRYVRPALTRPQRRALLPVLLATPLLFAAGVAFAYGIVLGPAVHFLLGLGQESFDVAVRAQDYYSFVAMTLMGVGLVFEFPLVLLGLARLGIITSARLRANRRIAFVLVAIVAAMLPTVDPVSLVIEMVPLLGLFEASIWLVALQERSARRRERKLASAAGAASPVDGGDAG